MNQISVESPGKNEDDKEEETASIMNQNSGMILLLVHTESPPSLP